MNKRLIFILTGFAIALLVARYYATHPLTAKVRIGDTVFPVEVAVTEEQKQLGLGGRASLPEGRGMLFVYDHKETYNFWMRNMQFPLDFVWIDGNRVADIHENIQPPDPGERPAIVMPGTLVDKVLEINAGDVARYHIQIGDTVTFLDR